MGKAIQFFKDAYFELTKVTWLSKKEVVATTFLFIVIEEKFFQIHQLINYFWLITIIIMN